MLYFDISIEKKYLAYIIQDINCLSQTVQKVDESFFFSEESKMLFKIILDYYFKYVSIPTKSIIKTCLINKFGENTERFEYYKLYVLSVYNINIADKEQFNFVFDNLKKYRAIRNLINTLEKVTNKVNPDNVFESIDELQKDIHKINYNSEYSNVKRYDLSSNILERLEFYEKAKEEQGTGIPSGLSEIDKHIGGWRKGELIVVVGKSGSGKSIILLNFAENAAIKNYNVLYITIEMSYEEVLTRYHSLITEIPYHKIRNYLLTEDDKKLLYKRILKRQVLDENLPYYEKYFFHKKTINELYLDIEDRFGFKTNNLIILDISKDCNPQRIESEAKIIFQNKKCDLIVIDYLGVMEILKPTSNYVQNFMILAREIKLLARNLNVPIITAAQMNENEEVKYAKAIKENSDWIINFKVSEEDSTLDRLKVRLAKHRHAGELEFYLQKMFDIMKVKDYELL